MSVAERISCPLCKGQIRTELGRKRQVCQHCGQVFSWGLTLQGSSRALQEAAVSLAHLGSATLVRSKSLPCQSCGAEFRVSDKILSATCPFCDTALVRSDRHVHEHLPISGFLPFEISEDVARRAVDGYLAGSNAVTRRQRQRILREMDLQPAYLSYFLFDSDVHVLGRAQNISGSDASRRTIELKGWVEGLLVPGCETQGQFASIPSVDGEAWSLSDLRRFDPAGLAGLQAAYPVIDAHETAGAITPWLQIKITERLQDVLCEDERSSTPTFLRRDDVVRVILVPVWLGQYQNRGANHRVRVNGQSGEVGIEVPVPTVGGLLRILFAATAFAMLAVFVILLLDDLGVLKSKDVLGQ
ncbi:MAG: hypothetical protein AAFN27_10205 [Pseudomonadota bacterium]